MAKYSIAIFLLLLLFGLSACGLLEGPPQVQIPTPIPTAIPLPEVAVGSGEQVTDPVSDVVPDIDPLTISQSFIDTVMAGMGARPEDDERS